MIAWLSLLLALLPFSLTIWNLRQFTTPGLAHGLPRISVLLPARNEEKNIGAACAAILASFGVTLELIVLDDSSTDQTLPILQGIADRRLRIATAPPLPPGWSGKQHACHILSSLASYELLVFVDADVRLRPEALSRMAGFMQRNDCALASGFPRQLVVTSSEQLLLPLIHFLLLGFLPMKLMQARTDPGFGAGCGQLFIARREPYFKAGGHAAIRASLHDGLTLPRAFRNAGFLSLLFDATSLAECRMYDGLPPLWEGLCKNATEGMAKPISLPIWTVLLAGGQILPALLIIFTPSWPAAIALTASIATRLILANRFRQPMISALLQPMGIAALLTIQWFSLLRPLWGGRPTWRGRAYPSR